LVCYTKENLAALISMSDVHFWWKNFSFNLKFCLHLRWAFKRASRFLSAKLLAWHLYVCNYSTMYLC
jgi:hypothetical protein